MQLIIFNIIFFRISRELRVYFFDNYDISLHMFRFFVSCVRIDNVVVKIMKFSKLLNNFAIIHCNVF